jgi:hypothetical protein
LRRRLDRDVDRMVPQAEGSDDHAADDHPLGVLEERGQGREMPALCPEECCQVGVQGPNPLRPRPR